MKLDPGMHIGLHLVFFGKSGVTPSEVHRSRVCVRVSIEVSVCASCERLRCTV
jgi:hypothetical protein